VDGFGVFCYHGAASLADPTAMLPGLPRHPVEVNPAAAIAPDIVGEVVGWRSWAVDFTGSRARLVSLSWATVWPPRGWMVATCKDCADVPGEPCRADSRYSHGCGIHAGRDRPHLQQLGYTERSFVDQLWPEHGGAVVAIGEVGLAGKVIVGAKGWRAERGRPLRLYLPYDAWRAVKPLAAAYEVPVELAILTGEAA
jgi:hypothetical protein